MTRINAESAYMQWSKLHSHAEFNLASSGMAAYPLAELDVKIEQLEINGPVVYGYEPLRVAIAARYRVNKENVVTVAGTSMANHMAMSAVTEPGDEILIEQPTYEPLLGLAKYLGLRIKRFARPCCGDKAFQPDLADLQRKLSRDTRLVVLNNLHNPSGVLIPQATMKKIGELARDVGARVLVDEVYLEMLFQKNPETAFHLDPERFLITNSLTKGYGLSGLRCGWILASADIAQRIWRIDDLYSASPVFPAQQLSVVAFAKLDKVAAAASASLGRSRELLRKFLDSRKDLECVWPEYGTVVFPRLLTGDVHDFCAMVRDQFKTTVVPGKFFEMPEHFRIGVGGGPELVAAALQQLGRGLDAHARTQKSTASSR
jgi:aspartate/methionine/tyrosine aminotransferase